MIDFLLLLSFALLAMGLGRINPGCRTKCCPAACDIFADDFTTDNLATNYTTNSGTGTVASGYLSTASTGYNITCNTAHSSAEMKVTADVYGATSGDQLRIKVAETDTSNYLYGQLEVVAGGSGGGTLKVFKVVTGTHTELDSVDLEGSAVNGVSYTLEVCYADGILNAFLTASGSNYVANAVVSSTGTKFGLATGTITTEARFDNLNADSVDGACPYCSTIGECGGCVALPQAVELDIFMQDHTCTNCICYDGTYILPYQSVCTYLLAFSGCDSCAPGGLDTQLKVVLQSGVPGGSVEMWNSVSGTTTTGFITGVINDGASCVDINSTVGGTAGTTDPDSRCNGHGTSAWQVRAA